MAVKVLLVEPPSAQIINILYEGILYSTDQVEFDVLSNNSLKFDDRFGIKVIDKKQFTVHDINIFRKTWILLRSFIKCRLDLKKSKEKAVEDIIKILERGYYKSIFAEYDIVNIQYLRDDSYKVLAYLQSRQKVIVSFWGSDLYKIDEKSLYWKKKSIEKADIITLHHSEMEDFFISKFGTTFQNKIQKVLFGISFRTIKRIEDQKHASHNNDQLKMQNFSSDKIIVRIGYNGSKSQQHIDIVKALSLLDVRVRDRLHLIVMMTYGGDDRYYGEVERLLKSTGISFSLYSEYLDKNEVLAITMASDIFINCPLSDAFNNAMVESILFEKLLISGTWLNYGLLKDIGVFFLNVDAVSDITFLMEEIIECEYYLDTNLESNPGKIKKLVSNINTGKKWSELFLKLNNS